MLEVDRSGTRLAGEGSESWVRLRDGEMKDG